MCLEVFTRSYMETALWSSSDESNDQGGEPMDANYSIGDIADETINAMAAECRDFYMAHSELWSDNDDRHAGHDFWLTRNHHGAGFWDGDYVNGKALTDAAHACGEAYLYVGDDGVIYQAGTETMDYTVKATIRVTYEVVTPESAEDGDTADSGWRDEEGTVYSFREAVKFLRGKCVVASSSYYHPGIWYTDADSDIDSSTDAETRESYHVDAPEGFQRRLYAAVIGQ